MSIFDTHKYNKAQKKMEGVSIEMQIGEPYLGSVLSRVRKLYTEDINTVALQNDGVNISLLINPVFIDKLAKKEISAICKHVLLHICLGHLDKVARINDPSRIKRYHIACDLSVNQYIKGLPSNALTPEKIRYLKDSDVASLKSADEFYYLIRALKTDTLKTIDCHLRWGGPRQKETWVEEEKTVSNTNMALLDAQTYHSETFLHYKAAAPVDELLMKAGEDVDGKVPGFLSSNEIRDIACTGSDIPMNREWGRTLRKYLNRLLNRNSLTCYELKRSFRRPNRKTGFPFPSLKVESMPILSIAVCIDGSGSIDNRTFNEFISEINSLYDREIKISLIGFDFEVKKENVIIVYDPSKWVGLKKVEHLFKGELGGGTDFVPPVEAALNLKPKPDCILMFTDSFDQGNLEPPGIPIVFVLSQKNENFYPWAECIHMV